MFWKMANLAKDQKLDDFIDVFSLGAGQLPQVNQAIGITAGWVQYLSGHNPYDAFRGRNVIDDTTFEAGGGASLKKMAEWTASELGLATFASYDTSKDTTAETFLRIAPWFNRVIKVSDYGLTEQLKESYAGQKQVEAKISLKKREVISEYSKNIDSPSDINNAMLIKIENEVYGEESNDKARRSTIRNSLLKSAIRSDSPAVDSLLSATSNAQKAVILRELKENMSADDYADLKIKLVQFKVVSNDLLKTIR